MSREKLKNIVMKKLLLLSILVLTISASIYAQQKIDTLTNEEVISLSKIGLQPSVIINKIHSSYSIFDVSTNALIDLSKNGVDSQVINVMMEVNNASQAQVEMEQNSTNPEAMHKAGIYLYDSNNAESPLTYLDPISVNYTTSSGGYGGWGGSSTHANMNGKQSKFVISKSMPVFYFYFPKNEMNNEDWFASSSPNDFELAKLIITKDSRRVKVAAGASFGYGSNESASIPEEFKVPFKMDKVNEGIYKVTFTKPLPEGEYCFVFRNDTDRVFDFSIKVK